MSKYEFSKLANHSMLPEAFLFPGLLYIRPMMNTYHIVFSLTCSMFIPCNAMQVGTSFRLSESVSTINDDAMLHHRLAEAISTLFHNSCIILKNQ